MRRRYKIVLNVEIDDPYGPFPAGGDYTHLNRINGVLKLILTAATWLSSVKVSLDKLMDKGEILPVRANNE